MTPRKLFARLRWQLALWLDRRHPEWCWANLATDLGLGWDLRNWRENAKNTGTCDIDIAANGVCWCGKRMKEPAPPSDRQER